MQLGTSVSWTAADTSQNQAQAKITLTRTRVAAGNCLASSVSCCLLRYAVRSTACGAGAGSALSTATRAAPSTLSPSRHPSGGHRPTDVNRPQACSLLVSVQNQHGKTRSNVARIRGVRQPPKKRRMKDGEKTPKDPKRPQKTPKPKTPPQTNFPDTDKPINRRTRVDLVDRDRPQPGQPEPECCSIGRRESGRTSDCKH